MAVATRTLDFAGLENGCGWPRQSPSGLLQQIVEAFPRLSSARQCGLATDIDRFVEAGSWTDFALGLVRLELPTWRIRRITCEGGEWFCSLSRQPNLPLALDEAADGTHDDLPLAILRALVEALRVSMAQQDIPAHVPLIGPRGNSDLLRQICLNAKLPRGAGDRPLCQAYKTEVRSISNSYMVKRRLRTNRKKRRR